MDIAQIEQLKATERADSAYQDFMLRQLDAINKVMGIPAEVFEKEEIQWISKTLSTPS